MSIENNLKRIADAVEKIADYMTADKQPGEPKAPKPIAPPNATPAAAPAAPQKPEAVSDTPEPKPVAPAAPVPSMTPEELNEAMIVEFRRLGKRDPIDTVLAQFGVSGVTQLEPAQYQPVLDAIKAIPA